MLVPLQLHLRRFALHTGVQRCNAKALHHWSRQKSFPTVQCCSVKQAHSMLVPLQRHLRRFALLTGVQRCKTGSQHACATANTPMEICTSCRCAVIQHQFTAALVKAEKLPHCSVLHCKTGSQHACATANTSEEICSTYTHLKASGFKLARCKYH